jgi:hypothetical protein
MLIDGSVSVCRSRWDARPTSSGAGSSGIDSTEIQGASHGINTPDCKPLYGDLHLVAARLSAWRKLKERNCPNQDADDEGDDLAHACLPSTKVGDFFQAPSV